MGPPPERAARVRRARESERAGRSAGVDLPCVTLAQSPVADLELSVEQGLPPVTLPGATGDIVLRVVNHGPDTAGIHASGDNGIVTISRPIPYSVDHGVAVHFLRSVVDDCVRLTWSVITPAPGQEPRADYIVEFPPIDPGQSYTCTLEYRVNPHIADFISRSPLPVEWFVGSSEITDPDRENDEITLFFTFLTQPIPALDPVGLTLLALGMLMAFVWGLRRHARLRRADDRSSLALPGL